MFSPITGRSRETISVTSILRCTPAGEVSGLRMKSRMRPVMAAPRSAAVRISSSSRRPSSCAPVRPSRIPVYPLIKVSTLAKSCATPAASLPSVSILNAQGGVGLRRGLRLGVGDAQTSGRIRARRGHQMEAQIAIPQAAAELGAEHLCLAGCHRPNSGANGGLAAEAVDAQPGQEIEITGSRADSRQKCGPISIDGSDHGKRIHIHHQRRPRTLAWPRRPAGIGSGGP